MLLTFFVMVGVVHPSVAFFLYSGLGLRNPLVFLLVLLVIVFVSGFFCFRQGAVRVAVSDEAVEIRRRGGETAVFARGGRRFLPNVKRRRLRGVSIWTTRNIMIVGNDGEATEVYLPNFPASDFDRLMATLARRGKTKTACEERERPLREYHIRKPEMLREFRRMPFLYPALGTALLLALVFAVGKWHGVGAALSMFVFVPVLVTYLGIDKAIEYRRTKRRTPSYLSIDDRELRVDDAVIPLAGIDWVRLTPPGYRREKFAGGRVLRIGAGGKKKTWYLGSREPWLFQKTVFNAYGDFSAALEKAAHENGFALIYEW